MVHSDWNESRMSHQLQHPEHERVMWFRSDQEGDFEPLPLPQGSHQCIRIRERAKADRKARDYQHRHLLMGGGSKMNR
ncbi:hypothetical protein SASPL_117502 [Salvia splendens]|uniref:Uncharacterized protein n=1 Tax=Salvia splendens TaxID=180675 RepID=A0A8X8ZY80_SALSN|nr:hypothetical protein SASPL_117502 [Salvia splendens]